jgi:type IV pilus assembly protein PilA
LHLSEFAKESVAAYWKAHKKMPRGNAEAGLPPADKIVGNYVTSLEVVDGAIHVTLGNRVNRNAAGKVLSVRAGAVQGYAQVPLAWNCGMAAAPAPMAMFGENRTNLPPAFLPVDCRS